MRGIWHFEQYAGDENRTAEMFLRRAIDLDPNLALAHSYLARTLNHRVWKGWSEEIDQGHRRRICSGDESGRGGRTRSLLALRAVPGGNGDIAPRAIA